jgi:radical SAM superfamily enzyme
LGIPVLTVLILVFVVWLQYEIRKNSRQSKDSNDRFWEKEKTANQTRRKDISDLNYMTISLNLLPMEDHEDDTINSYRDTMKGLSGKKMINLAGLTNTELKYRYGAANLNILSEYDNNYTIMVSILQKWAERLYLEGFLTEAQSVLEYSISCLTDVTKSYRLLAEIYHKQKQPDKINDLINMIPKTKLPEKEKLIQELTELLTQ